MTGSSATPDLSGKRIGLFVAVSPAWGGSFQYAENVLRTVAKLQVNGVKVTVWHTEPEIAPLLDTLKLRRIRFDRRVRWRRCLSFGLRAMRKIVWTLSGKNLFPAPEYVEILLWRPDVLVVTEQHCLPLSRSIRQMAPIHDLMHIYEPSFPEVGTPDIMAERNHRFADMVARCSDILVDSPLGKDHVQANFNSAHTHIHVLPYAPSSENINEACERPQAVLPERFFYYPAQFWEHKNHVGLVEALAVARTKCPDIHCVLSGDTDKNGYESFTRRAGELNVLDSFSVLGYVASGQVAWLYRHAEFLCMPSFFGPTNIPPLEAMACGCPVAVSRIYAMPWQCGEAALYFDPHSAVEMAETLVTLWNDPVLRQDLSEKGLQRARRTMPRVMQDRCAAIIVDALRRT